MEHQNNRRIPRKRTATPAASWGDKCPVPRYLNCDEDEWWSEGVQRLCDELLDQVNEAFSKEPNLGGVITGRREITLGKRGTGRPSHFPSKKNAFGSHSVISLPVESRVESMYALELERDAEVRGFRTQAIELPMPGSKSSIYPDFLVLDTAGRYHIREVKADKRFVSPKMRMRNERLAAVLQTLGFSYGVVDLSDMPQGMKSANLFWLHKQFSRIPSQQQIDEFMALEFTFSTYGELQSRCVESGQEPSVVPYLLFMGRLNTYWGDARITDDSGVWK